MEWLIIYYIAVNACAFLLYGADKNFAKKDMRRIPEKTLLGIAAIGGAFGAFLGMELFRHKTKHAKFMLLVPVLMAAHLGFLSYIFTKP